MAEQPQNSPVAATVALSGRPGFGWIDGFIAWNRLLRLLFLTLVGVVIALPLYLGGASIGVIAGSLGLMVVFGAILAVFVVLARGAVDPFGVIHDVGRRTGVADQPLPKRVMSQALSVVNESGKTVIG